MITRYSQSVFDRETNNECSIVEQNHIGLGSCNCMRNQMSIKQRLSSRLTAKEILIIKPSIQSLVLRNISSPPHLDIFSFKYQVYNFTTSKMPANPNGQIYRQVGSGTTADP